MAVLTGLIAAAGAVGAAAIGSGAAKSAAKAQTDSAALGVEEQRRQYDQTRTDMAPWREAGGAAIGQLSQMIQPGYDHTTSPGYQFRFNEGQRAVESSAASKGMLMSGGNLKDLVRYGQGVAAQDYGDQFNRVASVSQGGQQAATNLGQFGANASNQISNLYTQAGNAKASGYVGSANAWGQGIGNISSMFANGQFGSFGGGGGGSISAPPIVMSNTGQLNSLSGGWGGW